MGKLIKECFHKQYFLLDIILKRLNNCLFLVGDSGVGKTHMIRQYVANNRINLYMPEFAVNGSLFGSFTEKGYQYSALEKAIINGGVFFYDEMKEISSENERILKILFEHPSSLVLGDGKEYSVNPNFYFVATGNTLTNNSAINDRMYKLTVYKDRELDENLKKRFYAVDSADKIRYQLLDELFYTIVSDYNFKYPDREIFRSTRELLEYKQITSLLENGDVDAETVLWHLLVANFPNDFLAYIINNLESYKMTIPDEKTLDNVKEQLTIKYALDSVDSDKLDHALRPIVKEKTRHLIDLIKKREKMKLDFCYSSYLNFNLPIDCERANRGAYDEIKRSYMFRHSLKNLSNDRLTNYIIGCFENIFYASPRYLLSSKMPDYIAASVLPYERALMCLKYGTKNKGSLYRFLNSDFFDMDNITGDSCWYHVPSPRFFLEVVLGLPEQDLINIFVEKLDDEDKAIIQEQYLNTIKSEFPYYLDDIVKYFIQAVNAEHKKRMNLDSYYRSQFALSSNLSRERKAFVQSFERK